MSLWLFSGGGSASGGISTGAAIPNTFYTAGSIMFADGSLVTQNNANFFWDNTNFFLGIQTATPDAAITIGGFTAGTAGRTLHYADVTATSGASSIPKAFTFLGSSAAVGGTDKAGGGFIYTTGAGTGTGAGGAHTFNASPPAAGTGSALNVIAQITKLGYFGAIVGPGSTLGTTDTYPFLYLTASAGIPSGVPVSASTSITPVTSDSTNHNILFYTNSAWYKVRSGSSAGIQGGVGFFSSVFDMNSTAAGTTGQILQSAGTGTPTWSTPTYPSASGTSGKFLVSDGTNYVASTPTIPATAGTSGKVLISDGTNFVSSTPTFPNASATSGKMIQSDGTNWVASAVTWPTASVTAGKIVFSDGTNFTTTSLNIQANTATTPCAWVANSASAVTFVTAAANSVLSCVSSTLAFTTTVAINMKTANTRQTGLSMSAGTAITPTVGTDHTQFVVGNGGAVTITASPPVSVTSMVVGQMIDIIGTSDTNTVTYTSSTAFVINGSCTLGKDQILTMMYLSTDGSNAAWVERHRNN